MAREGLNAEMRLAALISYLMSIALLRHGTGLKRYGPARITLAILFAVVVAAIALYFVQRLLLFPRHATAAVVRDSDIPADVTRIWLTADDSRVEAWLQRRVSPAPTAGQPTVLYFHGNAEIIDVLPRSLDRYRRLGFNVVLLEYPGYGRSSGWPGEQAILSKARELLEHLQRYHGIKSDELVYHGRSLGGGVAVGLAASNPPRALILESTFTSVTALATRMGMPGWLVRDTFDSETRLKLLDCDVLLLHGHRDEVVPVEHSEALAKASSSSVRHVFDAGHNDLGLHADAYWVIIAGFLAKHF